MSWCHEGRRGASSRRNSSTALLAAASQAAGSCSAWPGRSLQVAKPADPQPTVTPSRSKATTLTAEVPRSIPNTSFPAEDSAMGADIFHHRAGRLERSLDVIVRMCERDEQILERMRMKQDAPVEHAFPPEAEQLMAGMTGGVAIVADSLLGEPDLQYRSHPGDIRIQARIAQGAIQTGKQAFTTRIQSLIHSRLSQLIERRVGRSNGDGVGSVSARHRHSAIRDETH